MSKGELAEQGGEDGDDHEINQTQRGPRNAGIAMAELATALLNHGVGAGLCAAGLGFGAFGLAERIDDSPAVNMPVLLVIFGFAAFVLLVGAVTYGQEQTRRHPN